MKRSWLFVTLLFATSTVAFQTNAFAFQSKTFPLQINIDQDTDPLAGGFGLNPLFSEPLGQSFTAVTPHIKWIGFNVNNCPNPTEFQVALLEGSGTSGTVVATQTATAAGGLSDFVYFDFSTTPLVVGSQYTGIFSQISENPPDCAGTGVNGTGSTLYDSKGTDFISGAPSGGAFLLRVLTSIFAAQVQPPLNPDGSSTFKRGTVIPVKFNLTADGAPTCNLPPAKIAVRDRAVGFPPLFAAPLNAASCQYTVNMPTGSLAPGTYEIDILLGYYFIPTPLQVASVNFTVD
jgi:hypothetical protein